MSELTTGELPPASPQAQLAARRLMAGTPGLAQVWFRSQVLDRYRANTGYKILRTNSAGRVRGNQWSLDFGIAGESDLLIHLSASDLAERLPEGEREHWAAHLAGLPVSANFLTMQLTRGACIDDGELRAW